MSNKKVYICFDYDHDAHLKYSLVSQSKNPDSTFDVAGFSVKKENSDWNENTRKRIQGCDIVIVICGQKTDKAAGISTELKITRQENKSYFLLAGYPDKSSIKPKAASGSDKMYIWTWDNLKILIDGAR